MNFDALKKEGYRDKLHEQLKNQIRFLWFDLTQVKIEFWDTAKMFEELNTSIELLKEIEKLKTS